MKEPRMPERLGLHGRKDKSVNTNWRGLGSKIPESTQKVAVEWLYFGKAGIVPFVSTKGDILLITKRSTKILSIPKMDTMPARHKSR